MGIIATTFTKKISGLCDLLKILNKFLKGIQVRMGSWLQVRNHFLI